MIRRINLLPEDLRTVNKRVFYIVASLSLILSLSILYFISQKQKTVILASRTQSDLLQKESNRLSAQNAGYKELIDGINMTEKRKKEIEEKVGFVRNVFEGRTMWSDYLYELSGIVPAGVWFTNLSTSDVASGDKVVRGLKVDGMAFSSTLITDFMAAIEASPLFIDAALIYVQSTVYHGREAFSFEITFRIGGKK